MAEVPRRLVLDADMPRYLIRGNALLGFRHERHSHEPFLQREVGIVEQGASRSREVQGAIGALVFTVRTACLALCVDPVDLRTIAR